MTPFEHGIKCAQSGYSIYYNPYRHKGTAEQYLDWEDGWISVMGEAYPHG